MADAPAPLLGIAGWKGSGKTTLIARLLPLLSRHGLRVATIKHTHHPLRAHDGATDGERHAQAGACACLVIGPETWELAGVPQSTPPPSLPAAAGLLAPADLILVEGCKSAPIDKIEVRSGGTGRPALAASDPRVIAIAADHADERESVPVFARDDAEGLASFIVARLPHLRDPLRSQTGPERHASRSPDRHRRRT